MVEEAVKGRYQIIGWTTDHRQHWMEVVCMSHLPMYVRMCACTYVSPELDVQLVQSYFALNPWAGTLVEM